MNVTTDSLLRGAWFSLEQSGLLLEDAVESYNRGRLATAVFLALMAREELGKSALLLGCRKSGRSLAVTELREKLDDHVEKQRRGQISTALYGQSAGEPGKSIRAIQDPILLQSEGAQIFDRLHQWSETCKKRAPNERHELRMNALYVDIREDAEWTRPCNAFTPTKAFREVSEAIGDYTVATMEIDPTFLYGKDLELAQAIGAWSDRPKLLNVLRPDAPI